jgi:pimeloyl-ACP methyl ester carboxylesterase
VAKINIDRVSIAYDIIGRGRKTAVITPGGRSSKDTPGVRALAEKLAAGGLRVLIWDRPNCGESDLCFSGHSESLMNADALAGLLRTLNLCPAQLIGGSAGSRVSLITAARHPEVVERMFLFWISGGAVSLASLAFYYCHDSLVAAEMGGMEAVAALPCWTEPLARNIGNRDILLGQNVSDFVKTMKYWAESFFPLQHSPVPGVLPSELRALKLPVMVLRSGISDFHHPREVSEAVQAEIPGAEVAEPPWGDREWIERLRAQAAGEGLFLRWPLLAPQILRFSGV